jgi:hypothetical protein
MSLCLCTGCGTFMCQLSRNSGASTSWNPKGLSRPVAGKLYLYLFTGCGSGILLWVPGRALQWLLLILWDAASGHRPFQLTAGPVWWVTLLHTWPGCKKVPQKLGLWCSQKHRTALEAVHSACDGLCVLFMYGGLLPALNPSVLALWLMHLSMLVMGKITRIWRLCVLPTMLEY